ncbi:MAG: aldehyde dehydrogenase family protein, partial [Promethearchaeota archaeon]
FTKKLVELTRQLKQDNPVQPGVDVGAMINEYQLNKVLKMIEIAKDEGATILCGGQRNSHLKGYFLEPTILDNCHNNMKCVQEEIFGPVLAIIPLKSIDDVIKMVNANQFGLTCSIWTRDLDKAKQIASEIDAGTIMINECVYTFGLAATPWGGLKSSGMGRTHGKFGFLEVMIPIHINIDASMNPDIWWMPYNKEFSNYIENFKLLTRSMIVDK